MASFREIIFGSTVRLQTAASLESCVARLKAVTDEDGFPVSAKVQVSGDVGTDKFTWQRNARNAPGMGARLAGTLATNPAGTGIICRFEIPLPGRLMLCFVSLGFAILLGLVLTLDKITINGVETISAYERLPFLGLMLPIMLFFYALFGFLRFLGREDQPFMLQLLKETLEAHEVSSPSPGTASNQFKKRSSMVER